MKNVRTASKVLGMAALSCVLLTPALAHQSHRHSGHSKKHHATRHHDSGRYGNHYYDRQPCGARGSVRHHRDFVVPVRLTRTTLASYRDYRHGRVYYKPHRHHHAVYRFPVYTRAGWDYQPHYYCNGELYRERTRYGNHHVRFSLRF